MAETCDSLRQTHSVFHALDPISLLLSQNSSPSNPVPLRLTTESYIMERGPRYRAYAELRETKLRIRSRMVQEREETEFKQTPTKKQVKFSSSLVGDSSLEETEFKLTPTKKQVKFSSSLVGGSRKKSSVLAQSVPDFSAALRKENRKPPITSGIELTPPPSKNWSKVNVGSMSNSRGSKSANAMEKKGGLMMARKSYASVEELKGISLAAATAINGENRGGKNNARRPAGNNKTVLGYRQF